VQINEFLKVAADVANQLDRAKKTEDKDTLPKCAAYWEMFNDPNQWFEDMKARGEVNLKAGNPGHYRATKVNFHKWITKRLADQSLPTYVSSQTKRLVAGGEVLTLIPNQRLGAFSGEVQIRPLYGLVAAGYGDKIVEAIDLAAQLADGGQVSSTHISKASQQIRTKYDHQRAIAGQRSNTPAAAERTEKARERAQDAFDRLMAYAAKSDNGPDEINLFLTYVEESLDQKATLKVVS